MNAPCAFMRTADLFEFWFDPDLPFLERPARPAEIAEVQDQLGMMPPGEVIVRFDRIGDGFAQAVLVNFYEPVG